MNKNQLIASFFETGYLIFNIENDELIDNVNDDIGRLLMSGGHKRNSKIYSYNSSPRIVESWKASLNCKALAKHPKIRNLLMDLYGATPKAFSTINFIHSTQQPLHSDYVHFGTIPELRLAGTWVALEDIDPRSGPLALVPKSHKLAIFDYQINLGLPPAKGVAEIKRNYLLYEAWVRSEVAKQGLEIVTPKMKKGDCIIWDANLLHGSPECIDNTITRKSQVTHWIFDDVKFNYNPNFSNRSTGKYVAREMDFF